jgi:hypothetical protein
MPHAKTHKLQEFRQLTPDELDAVAAFAERHGRSWKHELTVQWLRGATRGDLHRLRNELGPEWLEQFELLK